MFLRQKKAKEIFKAFNGSYFFMQREDVLEKYLSYQIPKEKEIEWKKELFNETLNLLNEKSIKKRVIIKLFMNLFDLNIYKNHIIKYTNDYLIEKNSKLDTKTKLSIVTLLIDNMKDEVIPKELKKDIYENILSMLKEWLKFPITISSEYDNIPKEFLNNDSIREMMNIYLRKINESLEKL